MKLWTRLCCCLQTAPIGSTSDRRPSRSLPRTPAPELREQALEHVQRHKQEIMRHNDCDVQTASSCFARRRTLYKHRRTNTRAQSLIMTTVSVQSLEQLVRTALGGNCRETAPNLARDLLMLLLEFERKEKGATTRRRTHWFVNSSLESAATAKST